MSEQHVKPTLAIASNNAGKVRELRALLGDVVEVRTLPELGLESPEETGETFLENAELKARYVFERTGLPTLADDSGLEVDALGGRPGVRSARYAGEAASDRDNRARLLEEMRDVPASQRTARFVSVIAIVDAGGVCRSARGTCDGTIGFEERGTNGFGYDPLFTLPDGRTMAELPADEKNRVSHRGKAMRSAEPILREALGIQGSSLVSVAP